MTSKYQESVSKGFPVFGYDLLSLGFMFTFEQPELRAKETIIIIIRRIIVV